ncbi:MAG: hypothetical protein CHACPFDD_03544 [Phycisphaerae bacterium]|nr:hypothetical protein [Phycisphaerae bacterium]
MKRVTPLAVAMLYTAPLLLAAYAADRWTYQGALRQNGEPAPDGLYAMEFAAYDVLSGGSPLATDSQTVQVTDGLFTVPLDFGVATPTVFNGAPRWLEISVEGTPLVPRQELTASPLAIWSSATRGISVDGSLNVGVGTSSPGAKLDVAGDLRVSQRAALGNASVIGPEGYYDKLVDLSLLVTDLPDALAWTPLRAFVTFNPALAAFNFSMYGADFELIVPEGNATDFGFLNGQYFGTFHYGSGTVDTMVGGGFIAQTLREGSVDFQQAGAAISLGSGSGTILENRGFYVRSGQEDAAGSTTLNTSIYVDSPDHVGAMATNYGIYLADQDFASEVNYAIYSAGGNCYFEDDVEVNGTLSKGGGSFKIDHPLDPQNKYLYHSFVESPDMMNIYNGNVVLDERGEATVTLPDWFEALNRDFRYQLTCIGGFAPVYVAEKVTANQFRIAGGTPKLEVSWQITGVRQDAFANAHRIPIEQDKPAALRGSYLHPDAFGQPESRGINAVRTGARTDASCALDRMIRQ